MIYCRRHGEDKEKIDREVRALHEKGLLTVLKESFFALFSPVIILGCIYTGVASPTEAAANATAYAREMSDQRIEEKKEQIRKSGTQIIELDENTRNEIRQKAQPVYDQIKDSIDPSLFEAYTQ